MTRLSKKLLLIAIVSFLFAQLTYATDDIDQASGLTLHEVEEMKFIREEEKLARDIYLEFYDEWGVLTFDNIAESEKNHMDAMLTLLNKYGIEDPVISYERGVFSNETLTRIYEELLNWGMKSQIDAMLVGAFIEEFDSLDLEHAMEMTEEVPLDKVYENLCEGSYNHLESFIYAYERRTKEMFKQATLEDALESIILEIEEKSHGTEAAISLLKIYTEEKFAEFMLETTLEPGGYIEGDDNDQNNNDQNNNDQNNNDYNEDEKSNSDEPKTNQVQIHSSYTIRGKF